VSRIKEIWNQLESNSSFNEGSERIRFSHDSPCDLYLGTKVPEGERFLGISISFLNGRKTDALNNLKGLRVEKVVNSSKDGYMLLNLVLTDPHFQDIFDVLINDIIESVLHLSDEKQIIKSFYNRLGKWKMLFEKYNPEGLSGECQRGLYGELHLLRTLLASNFRSLKIVQSWVGSMRAIQDFQFENSAVEVKISSGNNHQKVNISNERQLDESLVKNLFLLHFSLDVRLNSGQTLNDIVDVVRQMLINDIAGYSLFNQKLVEVGYFDVHKELYAETGYTIREREYYKIQDGFPRIKENDLPKGVGDIQYTINISSCSDFIVSESEVFKTIS
jgi:hypothetical protein